MKEFIKYYLMAIGICCIFCCLAFFVGGEDLLNRLAMEQMLGIQLTILAINIPSYCILISNVSRRAQEWNVLKPPINAWLQKAFIEQIFYIIIGFACSILLKWHLHTNISRWILLGITLTWLVMSIVTMWDTFKSILDIDVIHEQQKK